MNWVRLAACVVAVAACLGAGSPALALEKVSIVVFGPPSLGAFLQPVIKQLKLDEANGLAIDFAERTPDAYAAQFNSGEFQVGGSAAVLTVGLAAARGTTNYIMFDWFARQQGVDLAKVSVINTATPGLVGYALADRAAAVQLWEPAYTTLMS